MKDYAAFYQRLTAGLRTRPWMIFLLKALNRWLTKTMHFIYPVLLLYLLVFGRFQQFWADSIIPALCFVVLSLCRYWLNQPRPYEIWEIEPLIFKDTKGQSMPSRHVFSAVIISMCALEINTYLGLILLILSGILGLCRILGGIHYPKDVLVGYVIGLFCGSILLFI
ncbi:phosphatase PAP2 family protein [Streptococcus dentapri]|uniref:Phosphatase PAP2 family protein n=1 Tax=Streptococcus dentapri TaxID=573564 RepID=A0ABV8D1V4_9STRE